MHVLYYPLVTNDLRAPRRDDSWTRQVVRDTPGGWRCVLLFRPEQDIEEHALWERTRTFIETLEASVAKAADSAYLLTQRIINSLRESGIDANGVFRYAVLVTDGGKLHFYDHGFRCLLWGVPAEGSPPLRLVQEDKQNVIESREFPGLKTRADPQASPYVTNPIVAVVDVVEPDGVLPSFTKTLETMLVLGGPASLESAQRAESSRADAATWHLWEEMTNLAAVDIRRLESRLELLADRIVGLGGNDTRGRDIWQKVANYGVPAGLALALLFLLILLFQGPGVVEAPSCPTPATGTEAGSIAPASTTELPRTAVPPVSASVSPRDVRTAPAAASSPNSAPVRLRPRGAGATVATFLSRASPTDRERFTERIKNFVDAQVMRFLDGDGMEDKDRRQMSDAAVQLLTNRLCALDHGPTRVDGAVGPQTLQLLRRCARDREPSLRALIEAYEQTSSAWELGSVENRAARTIEQLDD